MIDTGPLPPRAPQSETVGSSAAQRSGQPLLALQILRFFAAATVLVHHAGYDADTIAGRIGRPPLDLERVFDWTFGIHLFFVLSGFIMTYAERDFGQSGAPSRFLLRRIIRVVPLYWLMTTAVLAGAHFAPALLNVPLGGWPFAVASYSFIPLARSATETHPVLGQGWTLNYEMLFYVAFAISMMAPRRIGLSALVATFVILVMAGRVLQPNVLALQTWTDPLLFEFLFGVAVGLVYESGFRLSRLTAGMLAAIGLALSVLFGPLTGLNAIVPAWMGQGGPAALIVLGFAIGPPWGATPLILAGSALGDASYSLYLSHPFTVRLLRNSWLRLGSPLPLAVYLAMACLVAVAVSVLLFRGVERPVTRLLRSWSDTGHRTAAPREIAEDSSRVPPIARM